MLSNIIVSSYAVLLEIAIWIILVVSFFGGWQLNGFFGAIFTLLMTFIFCVVFFGAFLTLLDIRQSAKGIERNLKLLNGREL